MNAESLIRTELAIRAFELQLESMIRSGDTAVGPLHTSLGHERIAATVCAALTSADWVVPYYRSHAWLLARGCSPEHLFQQLFSNRGADVWHLSCKPSNVICASAIVGQHLPVAVGLAIGMASRNDVDKPIVVAPVGDGAIGAGVAYESLLCARQANAPVLVCVEDNLVQNFGRSDRTLPASLAKNLASAAGVAYQKVEGGAEACGVVQELVETVRFGQPLLLHSVVELEHPHSLGPSSASVLAEHTHPPGGSVISSRVSAMADILRWSADELEAAAEEVRLRMKQTGERALAEAIAIEA